MKKVKKIIGISILLLVFIALFIFTVEQSSLTEALKGLGVGSSYNNNNSNWQLFCSRALKN